MALVNFGFQIFLQSNFKVKAKTVFLSPSAPKARAVLAILLFLILEKFVSQCYDVLGVGVGDRTSGG